MITTGLENGVEENDVITIEGQIFYKEGAGSLDYHIWCRKGIIEKQFKEIEKIKQDILISQKRLDELLRFKQLLQSRE